MSGWLIALTRDDAKRLFAIKDDDTLRALVEELAAADAGRVCDCGTKWDLIEREFGDTPPLSQCLTGGRRLSQGDDYVVSFVRPDLVPHIADAMREIANDGRCPPDIQAFYQQAAENGDSVIFAADNR